LLYALLKDFGDDVEKLEHGREPDEYRNIELLDQSPQSWPELVVVNALVDAAISVQLDALRDSEYAPLRQRVGKILDEEEFHAAHGAAWLKRIAGASADSRALIGGPVARTLPVILRWFGPGASGDELRTRFLKRVTPLLAGAGLSMQAEATPDFAGFNEATRRSHNGGPDAATIARIRGDKNRAYLMD
jgi:1,2-phenylacetyl-CoA epoxidase catalytic subunit